MMVQMYGAELEMISLNTVAGDAAVGERGLFLTSTVNPHKSLIYKRAQKETQKYLGTTNTQILKDYVN